MKYKSKSNLSQRKFLLAGWEKYYYQERSKVKVIIKVVARDKILDKVVNYFRRIVNID